MARARVGSVSIVTFCSTASHFLGPRIAAACLVCRGVTLYGTAPRDFSALSPSIFGPRAATRNGSSTPRGAPLHLRTKVCDQDRQLLAGRHVLVDAVEISPHGRNGLVVAMAAHALDHGD